MAVLKANKGRIMFSTASPSPDAPIPHHDMTMPGALRAHADRVQLPERLQGWPSPPLVPVLTARNRARAYPAAQASKAERTISARFRDVNRKIDILTQV